MADPWISSMLRYGLSPEDYAAREANIRQAGLPKQLTELAHGNPNIEDRFIGQMISTEQGRPEWGVNLFNKIAFGDPFLSEDERARTKAAGDLGRNMAAARLREGEEHSPEAENKPGFFDFLR